MSTVKKITLGIFDDHPLTSKGLSHFLNDPEGPTQVLFTHNSKAELLEEIDKQLPDVLVLDIIAPGVNGLDLFETALKKYPEISIVAFTSLSSPILVENLLSIGVKGYVNKRQPASDLLNTIVEVYHGNITVPPDFAHLTKKFREINNNSLSQREIEILRLIARECTSPEIAKQLTLSVNTVESHRKNIFHKLQVKNVAGLIMEASRLGYLS